MEVGGCSRVQVVSFATHRHNGRDARFIRANQEAALISVLIGQPFVRDLVPHGSTTNLGETLAHPVQRYALHSLILRLGRKAAR